MCQTAGWETVEETVARLNPWLVSSQTNVVCVHTSYVYIKGNVFVYIQFIIGLYFYIFDNSKLIYILTHMCMSISVTYLFMCLLGMTLVSVSVSILPFPGGDEVNTDAVTWTRHLTGCGQLAVIQVVMKGGSKAALLPTTNTSHNNASTSQCVIL